MKSRRMWILGELALAVACCAQAAAACPLMPVQPPVETTPPDTSSSAAPQEAPEEDETPGDLAADVNIALVPSGLRFHLWNGTIIVGQPSLDQIRMQTDFGPLDIPVDQITAIRPGLRSYPELAAHIQQLVEALGADQYEARQRARDELGSMGLMLAEQIKRFDDAGSAERRKHLEDLREELEVMALDESDFDTEVVHPLIDGDAVETRQFTVIGQIEQQDLRVQTPYGELALRLSDIRRVDRPSPEGQIVRRTVTVEGANFIQNNTRSTGLQVKIGDTLVFRADGQIVMAPWGNNQFSTPDGSPNFGWYVANEIAGGALVGRIGDNGKPFLIGSRKRRANASSPTAPACCS